MSIPNDPYEKVLSQDDVWVLDYWLTAKKEGELEISPKVESPLKEFITIKPATFLTDKGKGHFQMQIRPGAGMSPGVYPVSVAISSVKEASSGMSFIVEVADKRSVVVASETAKALIDLSYGDSVILDVRNVGLQGLSNVELVSTLKQDGMDLGSSLNRAKLIESLGSRKAKIELPLHKLKPGYFEVSGHLSSDQESPIYFSEGFYYGKPLINFSIDGPLQTGEWVDVPVRVWLGWNKPVTAKFLRASIESPAGTVFSDMLKEKELVPGWNYFNMSARVRANQSGNYSAGFSCEAFDKIYRDRSNVEVEYVPPPVFESLVEDVVMKPYSVLKASRNLQIVLLLMLSMIFASCITMAIFKNKIDRLERKYEKRSV